MGAMAVTAMARGQLTPRPTLTTAMEAMVDTVSATAMVVLATDTARGQLTPRPTLTTATEAMVVLVTDTAKGQPLRRRRLPLSPLAGLALAMTPRLALSSKRNTRSAAPILRLMPTTAMVVSMEDM